jgi:translation initiation factor eIF-2B subunit delta
MSSVPHRPISVASTASNQNPSNSNKNQQVKQNKSAASGEKTNSDAGSINAMSEINERLANTNIQQNPTGPPISIPPKVQLTKAERRATQEAQRAAKAQKQKPGATTPKPNEQQASANTKKPIIDHTPTSSVLSSYHHRPQSDVGESTMSVTSRSVRTPTITTAPTALPQEKRQQKKSTDERVTLFSHLTLYTRNLEALPMKIDSKVVHPVIIKLGLQYATRQIVGSNLRCVAFLIAIQKMLEDYEGPPGSTNQSTLDPVDLNAKLKTNISFLTKCRPNAVTMGTAIRHLKTHIERIPRNITNEQAKILLNDVIRNFIRDKIEYSSKAIAETYAITKITNGDVILIFGYSSLIMRILETAIQRGINFRVIIADSRPQQYGLRSAQRLLALNVKCTYVLINAVPFIISEVTKVLLGAHGLLGNGYVMSQVGTAQISLIAKTHNVPVLVCCETYKFCERVQTDSFVSNELGDPNDLTVDHPLLQSALSPSSTETPNSNLNILNMTYDVTPPTFISAVITELGILPCTSVAVVIRMQNKQLDDICGQEEQSMTTTSTTTGSNINVLTPLETVQ